MPLHVKRSSHEEVLGGELDILNRGLGREIVDDLESLDMSVRLTLLPIDYGPAGGI